MNIVMKFKRAFCVIPLLGASAVSLSAATLTFDFSEMGGDVALTVSGSISSLVGSGWTLEGSTSSSLVFVSPQDPTFNSASLASRGSSTIQLWRWTAPVTPNVWGPGGMFMGQFQSGDPVQFQTGGAAPLFSTTYNALLGLPSGYSLGTPISSSSIFLGETIASLGLTPGLNQSYTFGPDTVQIIATAATPVPEASGSIAGMGLALAGLYQLRRKKRAKLSVES
jgi:hypothetical protein